MEGDTLWGFQRLAAVALTAFVVALTVVATTFLAVEVALVVDGCEPRRRRRTIVSLLPRGRSAMALVSLALFVTLPLFVALVFIIVTAFIVVIAFANCCEPFVVYPHPSPRRRRRRTPPLPCHGLASAALSSLSILISPPSLMLCRRDLVPLCLVASLLLLD